MKENNKESRNSNNDVITQVQINWIRIKLERAEKNGFTTDTKAQILAEAKALQQLDAVLGSFPADRHIEILAN